MPDDVPTALPLPTWAEGLVFALPADHDRVAVDDLAAADEATLDLRDLVERFRAGANDTFTDLLVVGWSRGALNLVRSDSVLRDKRITWFVDPAQLRHLAVEFAAGDPMRDMRVALCSDRAQLPYLLELLPTCFSLAVLDRALCPPGELHMLGRTRFMRSRGSIDRVTRDMRHLWARLDRLGESIPLGAWRDAYAGRAALCLAAGPSLDRRMDFIRANMDRCVVITVDVLLARLQSAGIRVDFVLNVDSDDSLDQRLAAPSDPATVLVMPLAGHRGMDVKFPRRTYFGHGLLSRNLLGPDHAFSTGTTVGIASVGFAHYLGCREIVLLGHDLSFSETERYSAMVADREEHTKQEMGFASRMLRRIPGNGDSEVLTDYLFEVACQDIGIMLPRLPGTVAYNPNINDRICARIPLTRPLPDGWVPPGDGQCPRPDSSNRLSSILPKDTRSVMRRRIVDETKLFHRLWREGRAVGASTVEIDSRLQSMPLTGIAASWAALAYNGPLQYLLRLHSLPPSIGVAWHRAAVDRYIDACTEIGTELLRAWTMDDEPSLPRPATDTDAPHTLFYASVAAAVGDPEESPAESILMPLVCQYFADLLRIAPGLGLPTPQSAVEGLQVIRRVGSSIPDAYICQTLCLCALDGLSTPLEWARTTQVLPPRLLPADRGAADHRAGETCVDATNAVLRLRAGASTSLKVDGGLAAAWPPCHVHLVRALIGAGEAGVAALEKLVRRGDIRIDDQMASLVLLHAADFRRASAILKPFPTAIGEASIVAMAHRLIQSDAATARRYAASVRPLSRFKDQALTIECHALLRLGQIDDAARCCEAILDATTRERWLPLVTRARDGGAAVVDRMLAGEGLLSPEELAGAIADAWQARDGERLAAAYRRLLAAARHAPAHIAEYERLANDLRVLLRQLRVDHLAIEVEMRAELEREFAAASAARGDG